MKGGVLIIGSLFWDLHQGKHLNVRANWRANHLQFNNRIHVKVPIRYGRTSGKVEKKVYTMVFSHSLEAENKWGMAYTVPFKIDINDFDGLYEQAKCLSEAEGANDTNLVKRNGGAVWCVIGLLFNPKFDSLRKQEILDRFQKQLDLEGLGDDYERFCIDKEKTILTKQGEILIDWPTAINPKHQAAMDRIDFIIATCPKQNLEAYPDPKTIKTAVLKDGRDYFYNNVFCGITTFQDREIIEAK